MGNNQMDASDGGVPKATPEVVFARLSELGIQIRTHHHPALFTVEQSKALRGELPGGHCKNLLLRDKRKRMWLVVCLEDQTVNLKTLGSIIGADRLSFASADRLMHVLGVIPGAVSPFALINDTEHVVTVVLDKAMMELSPLNYHPISNEMTSAIDPRDLMAFIHSCGHEPMVVDLV